MADNTITVVGNLTRDPEIRYTAGGKGVANLDIAVNRKWMNRQTNEWEERTSFFKVVVFGEMADHCSESLQKGNRVLVTGRLEQRSWETEKGEKRNAVEIVADEVAPSLRYATAEVKRTERREGGSNYGGNSGGNSGGGNSGGRESSNEPAPAYDGFGDEEPF
jgi:single-strand DNA-binding protein